MKSIKTIGFQGDVMFERIAKLPPTAALRERAGHIVVSHSETGHHHVVRDDLTVHFEDTGNPLICYLSLSCNPCDVEHMRSYDTHETIRLLGNAGTIYKVRRQRERAPEGWRRVND
jgi:hypothetical protein